MCESIDRGFLVIPAPMQHHVLYQDRARLETLRVAGLVPNINVVTSSPPSSRIATMDGLRGNCLDPQNKNRPKMAQVAIFCARYICTSPVAFCTMRGVLGINFLGLGSLHNSPQYDSAWLLGYYCWRRSIPGSVDRQREIPVKEMSCRVFCENQFFFLFGT